MTKPYTKEQQLKHNKAPRRKRCKECNKLFVPTREMQPCCSFACEMTYATTNIDKLVQDGKKLREKDRRKAKSKTTLRKRVQDLAQKYGRLREFSRGNTFCVTCGSPNAKDGGHFLKKSKYPAIRYYTLQINPQCVYCNQYQDGEVGKYEEYMRKRFGDEKVDWLMSQLRVSRNYTVEYLEKYLRVMGKRIKRYEEKLK